MVVKVQYTMVAGHRRENNAGGIRKKKSTFTFTRSNLFLILYKIPAMQYPKFNYFIIILFCGLLTSCSLHSKLPAGPSTQSKPSTTYAIKNVTIIPMIAGTSTIANATVIIKGNKIQSLDGPIPSGAKIINGTGKYLMPGLVDMNVHIPTDFRTGAKLPGEGANMFFNTQDLMTPFIANGVTTIFELSAKPEHLAQRNDIAKGKVVGPRMALGVLLNGGSGAGAVNSPSEGRQAVRAAKAAGFDFIKLYSALSEDTFKAIIEEARKENLKTIGHILNAFQGKLGEAFVPNFGMVAHAEEFSKHAKDFSDAEATRFAKLLKDNGTWLSPTLTTMVWIASQAASLDELRASSA